MSATIIELSSRLELAGARWSSEDSEAETLAELRRARQRIAQLERNLTQAMRDSLANYNRARELERRIADLTG